LLGLLASALEFGQLTPRDAILGAMLGYVIPYIYNKANVSMNPHLQGVQQVHILLFASIGAWLGPVIAFEMMVVAILIIFIFSTIRKPQSFTFDHQMALIGLLAFIRILFS
jgi:prepilin signal peptidase PulO-like enzyme (type II secretory pathway)